MTIKEVLEDLEKEIAKKAEHYRTTQNDPHAISTAAYAILLEISQTIRKVKEKIQ